MGNNHMEEVAKMFGVRLGEKFKVNGNVFWFYGDGLVADDDNSYPNIMNSLLVGEYTIEKLPWKPQKGDTYWFIGADAGVTSNNWNDDYIDYSFYCAGNCFKTKESALEHAPEIIEKMKSFYENGGAAK